MRATVCCRIASQRALLPLDAQASCASGVRSLASHVSWQTPVYHGLSTMRCPAVLVLLSRLLCILAPALGGSYGRPACPLWFGMGRCCLADGQCPIAEPRSLRASRRVTMQVDARPAGCSLRLRCWAGWLVVQGWPMGALLPARSRLSEVHHQGRGDGAAGPVSALQLVSGHDVISASYKAVLRSRSVRTGGWCCVNRRPCDSTQCRLPGARYLPISSLAAGAAVPMR